MLLRMRYSREATDTCWRRSREKTIRRTESWECRLATSSRMLPDITSWTTKFRRWAVKSKLKWKQVDSFIQKVCKFVQTTFCKSENNGKSYWLWSQCCRVTQLTTSMIGSSVTQLSTHSSDWKDKITAVWTPLSVSMRNKATIFQKRTSSGILWCLKITVENSQQKMWRAFVFQPGLPPWMQYQFL